VPPLSKIRPSRLKHIPPASEFEAGFQPSVATPSASLVIDHRSSLTLSQVEVAAVFHLPLDRFTKREHRFCGLIPYWACDVTDLAAPRIGWSNEGGDFEDEAGGRFGGQLEIWGLMGRYLNLFMKIFPGGRCQYTGLLEY